MLKLLFFCLFRAKKEKKQKQLLTSQATRSLRLLGRRYAAPVLSTLTEGVASVIYNLKEKAQHIPTLAVWHHDEWSHLNPGGSVEKRIEKMQNYLSGESVPNMFVWVEDDNVIGSAGILACDMDTRPDFTPWLASVYVRLDRRNQGIGAALVKKVMQHAKSLGYGEIFLFTPDEEKFYMGIGWQTISKEEYRSEVVTVMKIGLIG